MSPTTPSPTTLIATLGGQPQVVTFALDLLLAQGEQIEQVYALYPTVNFSKQALTKSP